MIRRKWDSKKKALIVIQGLKGKPVADLCREHKISQNTYYQWRDQFLANAYRLFDVRQQALRESQLEDENLRLKAIVGELSVELKKLDEVFD